MKLSEWKKQIDAEQQRIAKYLKIHRQLLRSKETEPYLLTDDELEKIAGMLAYAVYPMPQPPQR